MQKNLNEAFAAIFGAPSPGALPAPQEPGEPTARPAPVARLDDVTTHAGHRALLTEHDAERAASDAFEGTPVLAKRAQWKGLPVWRVVIRTQAHGSREVVLALDGRVLGRDARGGTSDEGARHATRQR